MLHGRYEPSAGTDKAPRRSIALHCTRYLLNTSRGQQ
jgi:hypothetical protein